MRNQYSRYEIAEGHKDLIAFDQDLSGIIITRKYQQCVAVLGGGHRVEEVAKWMALEMLKSIHMQ